MWMMPLHLHVNQKSDYDMMMMMISYDLDPNHLKTLAVSDFLCEKVNFEKSRQMKKYP